MRKSRKKLIFETAIALFREKGFDAVTVQEVCDACGITKKAFYYHYASKEEIILSYFDGIDTTFDWDKYDDGDYFELYWKRELHTFRSHEELGPDLMLVMIRADMARGLPLYTPYTQGAYKTPVNQDKTYEAIRKGQALGQFRTDRTPEELVQALFASVVGMSLHWSASGGKYDLTKEIRKSYEIIMRPPT